MDTPHPKRELRRRMAARIAALGPAERAERDRDLCGRLLAFAPLREARTVMAYMPLPDEADILPALEALLARGQRLCFPRVETGSAPMSVRAVRDLAADLAPGAWSIREPLAACAELGPGAIDAILVPGRAFTAGGERLGRGGGFYDRFLCNAAALRIAVCYDEQLVDELPLQVHDQPVEVVLTPTRTLSRDRTEPDPPEMLQSEA